MSEQKKSPAWGSREIIVMGCLVSGLGLLFVQNNLSSDYTAQAQTMACINNLSQIAGAAKQFALDHHLTNGALINFPNDLTPYLKLNSVGKFPSCPAGGAYHLGKVGEMPTCSLGATVTPAHILP